MKITEFTLNVGGREVLYSVAEPDGPVADDAALLLTFSGVREWAMTHNLYGDAARVFVEAGHRALSYSMPYHAERQIPGRKQGLEGISEAFVAGEDALRHFVDEGIAALDEAERRGWLTPGRVHAYGISRGGYGAIRLTAADPRISATAALAPVVDWRALREWAHALSHPDVHKQALENDVDKLVGRCVYTVIGNHDDRVATELCVALYAKLFKAEAGAGLKASAHELHVISDQPGHGLPERLYEDVPRWLLGQLAKPTPAAVKSNLP